MHISGISNPCWYGLYCFWCMDFMTIWLIIPHQIRVVDFMTIWLIIPHQIRVVDFMTIWLIIPHQIRVMNFMTIWLIIPHQIRVVDFMTIWLINMVLLVYQIYLESSILIISLFPDAKNYWGLIILGILNKLSQWN